MSASPTDIAALIGFGCEAVLYGKDSTSSDVFQRILTGEHSRTGSYCILFIVSWIVLSQKRPSPNLSSPVVFANCLLFFCCTAHFALEFNHFYTTLVGFPIKSLENTYILIPIFSIGLNRSRWVFRGDSWSYRRRFPYLVHGSHR